MSLVSTCQRQHDDDDDDDGMSTMYDMQCSEVGELYRSQCYTTADHHQLVQTCTPHRVKYECIEQVIIYDDIGKPDAHLSDNRSNDDGDNCTLMEEPIKKKSADNSNGDAGNGLDKCEGVKGVKTKIFTFVMFSWAIWQNRTKSHLSKSQLSLMLLYVLRWLITNLLGNHSQLRKVSIRGLKATGSTTIILLALWRIFRSGFMHGSILVKPFLNILIWQTSIIEKPFLWAMIMDVLVPERRQHDNRPSSACVRLSQLFLTLPLIFTVAKVTYARLLFLLFFAFVLSSTICRTSLLLWGFRFWYEATLRRTALLTFWLVVSLSTIALAVAMRPPFVATSYARKIFHIGISVVFVAGLLFDPPLLRLVAGGAIFLLITLEVCRFFKLPFLHVLLQKLFEPFMKDPTITDKPELSPITLILGMSYPLVFELPSCYPSKSPLCVYSGVIGTGIGDTFAAIIGSKYGQHRWPYSKRTLEGSAANFMSSFFAVVVILVMSRQVSVLKSVRRLTTLCLSLTTGTLFEALSTTDDNLFNSIVLYPLLKFGFPLV